MTRVIVTGSRSFPSHESVRQQLDALFDALAPGRVLTVVHGACATGADAAARLWCIQRQQLRHLVIEEPHPAQGHPSLDFGPWPGAGPRRNAHMIHLGADLVLAFLDDSPCRGTRDTIRRAKAAGIDVREVTAP